MRNLVESETCQQARASTAKIKEVSMGTTEFERKKMGAGQEGEHFHKVRSRGFGNSEKSQTRRVMEKN